jgi:hypothetical protein
MTRLCALAVGLLTAALATGAVGCTESPAEAGESCTRSLQCAAGLACVEGECSADLTPLEDPDRVPMLTPPTPEPEPTPDAGVPVPPVAGEEAVPPPEPMPVADAAVPPPPPATDPVPVLDAGAGG